MQFANERSDLVDALSAMAVKHILKLGREGKEPIEIAHSIQNLFHSVNKTKLIQNRRQEEAVSKQKVETKSESQPRKRQGVNLRFCEACEAGDSALASELLTTDLVDINCRNEEGLSPLMIAAGEGHSTIVKRILKERSVDVNMVDSDGDDTALMLSVEGGHYDCVAMLVNYPGIDLLHEDRFGETCLRLAAIRKQFAIFELLKTAMTGSGKRRPKTP